jgi:hypothetical protein
MHRLGVADVHIDAFASTIDIARGAEEDPQAFTGGHRQR